jgi:hypothetical protein
LCTSSWKRGDERRLRALQKHLNTVKLLIVDELGYVPFTAVGSELLFEVFSGEVFSLQGELDVKLALLAEIEMDLASTEGIVNGDRSILASV